MPGAGPGVRLWNNQGAVESIQKKASYVAFNFSPPLHSTLTWANVAAAVGDVVVVFCSHESNGAQTFLQLARGGDVGGNVITVSMGAISQHEAFIAALRLTAGGVANLVLSLDAACSSMAGVAVVYAGLLNDVFDQQMTNSVPPDLSANPADSGLTPATTQAHELVLGLCGEILPKELAGNFAAPLSIVGATGTGSIPFPDCVTAGAAIVHAIGAQRSDFIGHTLAEWAAICATLKGA